VSAATATNTANYTIDKGITVSAASLGGDGRTVTLTTSALTPDTTYTLTVSNILDTDAPQIATEELKAGIDPLGRENKLVFAVPLYGRCVECLS
jgi:hypothetical protein